MGEVWIVEWVEPYENAGIVAVYDSKEKAEKRKKKIERASERYDREMERTKFESDMESPDYQGNDIYINKYRIY